MPVSCLPLKTLLKVARRFCQEFAWGATERPTCPQCQYLMRLV
jgi:hypothetical protein